MNRDSRFELLRIIAMFMVLMLHVNFFALHFVTVSQLNNNPAQALTRISLEMLALVAVNLFVMISGWWGIKPTLRGAAKLLFQCIFVIGIMFAVGVCTGRTPNDVEGWQEVLYFSDSWFVLSYLGLYLLAPVLNSFIENSPRRTLALFLVAFFVFQTLYGNFSPCKSFIGRGYSAFSFVGLYMLARYVRLYRQSWLKYGPALWAVSLVAAIAIYAVPLWCGVQDYDYLAMDYTAPTTVCGALGLLMWTADSRPWHSRAVNFVAASCFTVYLCHVCNAWVQKAFKETAADIYRHASGLDYMWRILLFMLAVYAGGILLDQLRKICWHGIEKIQHRALKK